MKCNSEHVHMKEGEENRGQTSIYHHADNMVKRFCKESEHVVSRKCRFIIFFLLTKKSVHQRPTDGTEAAAKLLSPRFSFDWADDLEAELHVAPAEAAPRRRGRLRRFERGKSAPKMGFPWVSEIQQAYSIQ